MFWVGMRRSLAYGAESRIDEEILARIPGNGFYGVDRIGKHI